jgi:penicillin amidase
MGQVFHWLLRITTGLLVVAVLAVVMVYYLASRSLPEYDKVLTNGSLISDVEIVRDNNNIPHIFAATDQDVFFGLGYAHAQDRLWQMIVMRRTAQGRLSEVFGTRTVDTDKLLRRLDLYGAAKASLPLQDPQTQEALAAYAQGVNARLAEINRDSLGRGAPELFLFNTPISPWTATDSIVMIKLMALQLAGHLQEEVLRARTSLAVPDPARLADILPDVPGHGIADLPEYASLVPGVSPWTDTKPLEHAALWPSPGRGLAGASNVWAAAPHRSANRGSLLANDPHLGFTAPTIWYLARLELPTGGVIGGSIPGIPALLVGRSDSVAWGLTSSYLDDQDLFVEELNPDNPEQYRTPDGWADFETRRTIIQIKDETPVTATLRWTENGPVLPGTVWDLSAVTPPGHVMSLGWTALSSEDTSMTAAINIMTSQTVEDMLTASEGFIAPSQNLTVIDTSGIAMRTIGAMPRRHANHDSQGRLPAFGWKAENRWLGTFPQDTNPEFVNPKGGLVGNTNNKMIDRPYPEHVSHSWGDTQRVKRWQRMMTSRQVHTRNSFVEAQLDTVSPAAQLLLLIGADLWYTGESAASGTADAQRKRALDLLADWNGEMNEHLPEPLIYAAWMHFLQQRLIRDDVGPLADEFAHMEPLFIERVFRNIDGASAWCDVLLSTRIETCTDMARLALDDAIVWIEEQFGRNLEALRWGAAHEATHDHPVLGEVPVLSYFVNIRQPTSGGDHTLQRGRTSGTLPQPFMNVHGAGYRGVYDLADPDSSVFITATGQSGHLLSRHYDDLGERWRQGEYIPMSLDIGLARAASIGITRIERP